MSIVEAETSVYLGRVVDGTGAPAVEDGAVVVRGDLIDFVGPGDRLPDGLVEQLDPAGRVVRLGSCTILPGIVDAHVHVGFGEAGSEEELALYTGPESGAIRGILAARRMLEAGVTSACDAASPWRVAVAVREAVDAGMVAGPRFLAAGRQLTSPQGLEDSFPGWNEFPPGQAGVLVGSRDELRQAIRRQKKERVDVVKVSGSSDLAVSDEPLHGAAFDAQEFELIAAEAHRLSMACAVHARTAEAVRLAAGAGFDWIYHASFMDGPALEAVVAAGTPIAPVLTLLVNSIESAEATGRVGLSAVDRFKQELEAAVAALVLAREAGVDLLAGSESGWSMVPYGEWHSREMELFVSHLGMSPLEALRAGTSLPGRLCMSRRGYRVGQLVPGYLADLLVVDGRPDEQISVLGDPGRRRMVVQGGRPIGVPPATAVSRRHGHERVRVFLEGRWRRDPDGGSGYLDHG